MHTAIDGRPRGTVEERFWRKVDKDGPIQPHVPHIGQCWVWTGGRHGDAGPGTIGDDSGKTVATHRLSYEIAHGPIPAGMEVCHRCDFPPCVRPDHLFLGTQKDNMQDMKAKGRGRSRPTHCPEGHEYTPENTYYTRRGSPTCRECARSSKRRSEARLGPRKRIRNRSHSKTRSPLWP